MEFRILVFVGVCSVAWVYAQDPEDTGLTLVFEDDFLGDSLNSSIWCVADNYTHSTYSYNGTGPLPSELQLYTKDEVYVENGMTTSNL